MNIALVMDQVSSALATLSGLRVTPYWSDRINPPAAVVGWPEITYDTTMSRGSDMFTLPVFVMVGTIDARTSRDVLSPYLQSVKAAVDGHAYTACHFARVASASVEPVSVGGVEYLAAVFQVEITGSG